MPKPPFMRELTYWINNRDARNRAITLAAIHESVGSTDALSLAKFCGRAGVSYHAAADNEKIVYMVPRSADAWHLRNGNPRSDGLCLCTPVAGYSPDEWLGPQRNKLDIAGWWLGVICADRGIDVLRCNAQNIRDALRGSVPAGGCIEHHDYTLATRDGTHTDPRGFSDAVWDYVLTRAQEQAGYIDAQNKDAYVPPQPEPQTRPFGGAIREYYETHNLAAVLGAPVGPEYPCPDGVGRFQRFERYKGTEAQAHIYWHPSAGTHEVFGAIMAHYGELRWEKGPLGYPRSGEFDGPVGSGFDRVSLFEGGWLAWSRGQGVTAFIDKA